ncbi:uncharacterized protein LOC141911588 [Tubulanus polymorphus]|uniref:uncharacterized protein LOC141911588 n=1 Tax=Tubulanus polymorphus TaxID=672921 RepID=UPI003DA4618E
METPPVAVRQEPPRKKVLKMVLRQKKKMNASTGSRSRKLNTSLNVSMVKRTLQVNNRALAKALTQYKEELNKMQVALLKMEQEKQDLHERLVTMEKLTNLKNEEIEIEVERRMQVVNEKLRAVLRNIGSLTCEAMDMVGNDGGHNELSLAPPAGESSDKENEIDAKTTNTVPLKRRCLNKVAARVPVADQPTAAPSDLSLIVEKSVLLDELNNISLYADAPAHNMSTVNEDDEALSRRNSSRSSCNSRRSGLLERGSIAQALVDRLSVVTRPNQDDGDTGNNERAGSDAPTDYETAAAFQKSKKIRHSNIPSDCEEMTATLATAAAADEPVDNNGESGTAENSCKPFVNPDDRPIPTLVKKMCAAAESGSGITNTSDSATPENADRPFSYTFIACSPPKTSLGAKRLSTRKKSKSGGSKPSRASDSNNGAAAKVPSIVVNGDDDDKSRTARKRRTYSLSPTKSPAQAFEKTTFPNSPMDMTATLAIDIELPHVDDLDLLENEVMPELESDSEQAHVAPSADVVDNQIERRQLSLVTHESRLKPPGVRARKAAVNESGKIEMAPTKQKTESSSTSASSDESSSSGAAVNKLKQFHLTVNKPGKFGFKAGRRDFSKTVASVTIAKKDAPLPKKKTKTKTRVAAAVAADSKLDSSSKFDFRGFTPDKAAANANLTVFDMSANESVRKPMITLNQFRENNKASDVAAVSTEKATPPAGSGEYNMADETVVVGGDKVAADSHRKQSVLNTTYDKDDDALINEDDNDEKDADDEKVVNARVEKRKVPDSADESKQTDAAAAIDAATKPKKEVAKKKISTRTKVLRKKAKLPSDDEGDILDDENKEETRNKVATKSKSKMAKQVGDYSDFAPTEKGAAAVEDVRMVFAEDCLDEKSKVKEQKEDVICKAQKMAEKVDEDCDDLKRRKKERKKKEKEVVHGSEDDADGKKSVQKRKVKEVDEVEDDLKEEQILGNDKIMVINGNSKKSNDDLKETKNERIKKEKEVVHGSDDDRERKKKVQKRKVKEVNEVEDDLKEEQILGDQEIGDEIGNSKKVNDDSKGVKNERKKKEKEVVCGSDDDAEVKEKVQKRKVKEEDEVEDDLEEERILGNEEMGNSKKSNARRTKTRKEESAIIGEKSDDGNGEDETQKLLKRIEGGASSNVAEKRRESHWRKTATKSSSDERDDSPVVPVQRKRHLTNRRVVVSDDDEEEEQTTSRRRTADVVGEQTTMTADNDATKKRSKSTISRKRTSKTDLSARNADRDSYDEFVAPPPTKMKKSTTKKSAAAKKTTSSRRTTKVKVEKQLDMDEVENIAPEIENQEENTEKQEELETSFPLRRKTSIVSLAGSDDGGSAPEGKRSSRNRKQVSYKELPVGAKLRQGDKCFGVAASKKK